MFVLFCYDDKLISVAQLSYLTIIWLNTFSWGSVSVSSIAFKFGVASISSW